MARQRERSCLEISSRGMLSALRDSWSASGARSHDRVFDRMEPPDIGPPAPLPFPNSKYLSVGSGDDDPFAHVRWWCDRM